MHKTLIGFYRLFTDGNIYSVEKNVCYSNWPSDPHDIGLIRAIAIYVAIIVASTFFYAIYWYSDFLLYSIAIAMFFLFSWLLSFLLGLGIIQYIVILVLSSPVILVELFVKGNARKSIGFANKMLEKTCRIGFGLAIALVINVMVLLFFNPNEFELQDTFNVCSMPKAALSKICNLSFKAKVPWESIKGESHEETIKRYDALVSAGI